MDRTEELQKKTGFAPVNGTQLAYDVMGQGFPLILIHGGLLDRRMWDAQVLEFATFAQVIRYDVRGYGQSQMPQVPYSDVQDLFELLRFLGIQKAAVLGLSLGSAIALDFTLHYPEMVETLLLAAPTINGYMVPTVAMRQRWQALSSAVEANDRTRLFHLWADDPMMPHAQEYPAAYQQYRHLLKAYSFSHYFSRGLQQPLVPGARERLAAVQVPTLIIVGDRDEEEVSTVAELLSAEIATSRKVVVPGVRHMLNMEQPDEFNRIVLEFLETKLKRLFFRLP
ncbi:alpha/beta fold hydrolase [Tengunoibacter tsumagoiensis]|uniref:Hydrolase n=1 Tax=Tengunoibacter tsumagoiensis TaxID=2014871 RepID=A0A402A9C7_9CHLR|nr:alpha/beta fold hydrolase [Tengunoibacter tsumagoiensis]GCE15551.1 hydrolase [Tengunoibacter tsumagoiensis]